MRSRSHRRSLVWQKRYLMLALQGYQESEKKLMNKVGEKLHTSWVPENLNTKRSSFK